MPRKPCYWTRKLELELVEFVKQNEFIWRSVGNTNHHIQQKYKAYAEFASRLGRGFTARSVRDRWVNIRSTFNHNLRRVDKSRETAQLPSDIYVPCWPLWKPLQFLWEGSRKEVGSSEEYNYGQGDAKYNSDLRNLNVKTEEGNVLIEKLKQENQLLENYIDSDDIENLLLRQGSEAEYSKAKTNKEKIHKTDCTKVLDDLISAMEPLVSEQPAEVPKKYLFFGKHVVEQLNGMREVDAACASRDIMNLLYNYSPYLTM